MRNRVRFPKWEVVIFCILFQTALANQNPSVVIGDCEVDSISGEVKCTYVVFSGTPAISRVYFPVSEECADQISIESQFFQFAFANNYRDNICGNIFGFKFDQVMSPGQAETFSVTFHGADSIGAGVVYVALEGDPNCRVFPVPVATYCHSEPSLKLSMESSHFEFQVKRPGAYAARLSNMFVTSDVAVSIKFQQFGNLVSSNSNIETPIGAAFAVVPVTQSEPPAVFLDGEEFGRQTIYVSKESAGNFGISIWARLVVTGQTSASNFKNNAVIQFELQNSLVEIDRGL
jgi:hypothetical protein